MVPYYWNSVLPNLSAKLSVLLMNEQDKSNESDDYTLMLLNPPSPLYIYMDINTGAMQILALLRTRNNGSFQLYTDKL